MKISKYEKKMRKSIKRIAKLIGKRGLTQAMRSSVSQRLDQGRIQISPQGIYLRQIKKKMVVTIDDQGHPVYHKYGWQPSNEHPLHLAVYQARGDVNGIIHAHPPYLSAMGLTVDTLQTDKLPDPLQVLGKRIKIEEISAEDADISIALLTALTNGNVVLLPEDGVLVVGRTLDHAFEQMDEMEHAAQIYTIAKSAGFLS